MYVATSAPELSPLFRSDTQGEILALLLLNPDRAFTVADLTRATGTAYASVHRVGLHHQVSANPNSPAVAPLHELVLLSYGPAVVIPKLLRGIDGIQDAYLYGSWTARRLGEPGSPPGDIDLRIVGDPPR